MKYESIIICWNNVNIFNAMLSLKYSFLIHLQYINKQAQTKHWCLMTINHPHLVYIFRTR